MPEGFSILVQSHANCWILAYRTSEPCLLSFRLLRGHVPMGVCGRVDLARQASRFYGVVVGVLELLSFGLASQGCQFAGSPRRHGMVQNSDLQLISI